MILFFAFCFSKANAQLGYHCFNTIVVVSMGDTVATTTVSQIYANMDWETDHITLSYYDGFVNTGSVYRVDVEGDWTVKLVANCQIFSKKINDNYTYIVRYNPLAQTITQLTIIDIGANCIITFKD